MKYLFGLFLVSAASLVNATDIAIVDATLYTGVDEQAVEQATILIRNGYIEAVGTNLAVPDSYELISAHGKIVTPGLIEPHSQIGLQEIELEATTIDSHINDYHLGPSFDISHTINPASTLFAINRLNGVTRAIVAPTAGNDVFAGWGAAIHLGNDDVVTHTQLAQFGRIDAGVADFVGGSRSAVITRLTNALKAAPKFRANRYRAHPQDYSTEDMQALKTLLSGNRPLVVEVHRKNEILKMINLTGQLNLSLVLLGASEAWQVANELAAANVAVILDPLDNLPRGFDRLGATLENAARLYKAGVRIAITSENSHNAYWLRRLAGNAVANGLPWHAGLAAITSEPARIYGLDDELGSVVAGKRADLVIWSGDPLEITNWAEMVLINGERIEMTSRQTRLLERYRRLDDPRPFGLQ